MATRQIVDFYGDASTYDFGPSPSTGAGNGDMLVSVYDFDRDGTVDNAERVGNIPADQLLKTTDTIDCGTF